MTAPRIRVWMADVSRCQQGRQALKMLANLRVGENTYLAWDGAATVDIGERFQELSVVELMDEENGH
jgi:hypothetical protein